MNNSFWIDLRAGAFAQGYRTAGGYRMRYRHAGQHVQPSLILLHGTGGHAESYSRNLLALAAIRRSRDFQHLASALCERLRQ